MSFGIAVADAMQAGFASDILGETITNLLSQFWYYVSFQFLDPWWWWLPVAIAAILAITAVEIAVRFYFVDSPLFRKAGGLAIVGIIVALAAYRKGENDARKHDANKPENRKPVDPPPPPQDRGWPRW